MKQLIAKFFDATFLRFILVGVVNTLVGTFVMFALYNLAHCSYWFSSAMNYVVGSVVSYFLNKYFTFKRSERDPKMVRWMLSGAGKVIRDNVAMLFGMCLFVALNYLGQRLLVFRADETGENA